jgi:pSer/pThr/pTyr-binding forkhead associated (FHA) protein
VIAESLSTDETLLILKIAFLVLLYGFIVLVARSATKDLGGAPQESIVLGAAEAARLRAELGAPSARFVVVASPELRQGSAIDVTGPTIVGRDSGSGIRLEHDEFASARHARIDPRVDGVYVEDLGSTNGTYLNRKKVTGPMQLQRGDKLQIGNTVLELSS